MRQEILDVDSKVECDWRKDYVLIGSDVVSLFPSLTAENTVRAVKNQILKREITY